MASEELRPWFPQAIADADMHAIKALAKGGASAAQQQLALEFIVNRLCATNDQSFRPDDLGGARDTAFAEGKRFVGLQIRKIVETPLDASGKPKVLNARPSRS